MKLIEFENSVQRKTVAEEEDKAKNDVEFILVDDKKDDSTVSKVPLYNLKATNVDGKPGESKGNAAMRALKKRPMH